MGRDRHEIHAQILDIERLGDDRLDGIGMDEHRAGPLGLVCDLPHRLTGADLVVGRHHRDQTGAGGDRVGHFAGVGDPGMINADEGQRTPQGRQESGAVEHRGVLYGGGDHPSPLTAG